MPALVLDGETREEASVSQLSDRVLGLKLAEFTELWLECGGESGPRLCLLISGGERGWLMYLRCVGDVGFSSRNPDYEGPPGDMLEYRLSNGQRDVYPAAWSYPTADLKDALVEFLETCERPRSIRWYDDTERKMVVS